MNHVMISDSLKGIINPDNLVSDNDKNIDTLFIKSNNKKIPVILTSANVKRNEFLIIKFKSKAIYMADILNIVNIEKIDIVKNSLENNKKIYSISVDSIKIKDNDSYLLCKVVGKFYNY